MKIYKTKVEIAKEKNVTIITINNWEKSWKIQKLFIDWKKNKKKAWYIIVVETLKELVWKL